MKNRLLLEKIMLSVAPAVTKYHLDLQLQNKSKGESDFTMHRDTSRYIAEDCSEIAAAIVEEIEKGRAKPKPSKAPVAATAEAAGKAAKTVTGASQAKTPTAAAGKRNVAATNGAVKS
jgi:hypothetical protein